MGILLFIVSVVALISLWAIVSSITVIYYLVTFKWKTGLKLVNAYFYKCAFGIDQFGNIFLGPACNWLLVISKARHYFFGDEDDSLSYVIAMNFFKAVASVMGIGFGNMLDWLDSNHMQKAIQNKIQRDMEALRRLETAGVISYVMVSDPEIANKDYIDKVWNEKRLS